MKILMCLRLGVATTILAAAGLSKPCFAQDMGMRMSGHARPTVSAVSPASGFSGGGTTVAITGTRFTSGAPVAFGVSASASVTYNSPTSLTATAPAESAGTVDIKVTTTSGASATSSADQFTYPAPSADGLIVAVPFHEASFGKLNCFANANDVGNFYGTNLAEYQIAIGNGSGPGLNGPTGFFSTTANGPPASDAQLCFVRIGAWGGRARMVGAWICYVVGIGTPCDSARGAVTALPALRALDCSPTCGTLAWTQDGVSLSATVGSLAGAETLDAAMAIINNAIVAAYPVTGANGATLTGSRIITSTCTGITGTIGDGWMNVTAVSGGNCIYPGGLIVETGAEKAMFFPRSGGHPADPDFIRCRRPAVISIYLQHLYADLQCADRGDGRLRAAAK